MVFSHFISFYKQLKGLLIENTIFIQQDKYIFHLYVFSTFFGRDIREPLPYLNVYSSVAPDDG